MTMRATSLPRDFLSALLGPDEEPLHSCCAVFALRIRLITDCINRCAIKLRVRFCNRFSKLNLGSKNFGGELEIFQVGLTFGLDCDEENGDCDQSVA